MLLVKVLREMINEVVTKANHNMSSQMIYTLKSFDTFLEFYNTRVTSSAVAEEDFWRKFFYQNERLNLMYFYKYDTNHCSKQNS